MKTAGIVLITLLVTAALSPTVQGDTDHTYMNNLSTTWTVVASVLYYFENSTPDFNSRAIGPNSAQSDEYDHGNCNLNDEWITNVVGVVLQVQGACASYQVNIPCDQSVVMFDNPAGGVDVYMAVYGDINQPQGGSYFTLNTVNHGC